MRFYTQQHSFYCGIDLHARTMYVCVLSAEGASVIERNFPTRSEQLLKLIVPYRQGVAERFADPSTSKGVEKDLELITFYEMVLSKLERDIKTSAKDHDS